MPIYGYQNVSVSTGSQITASWEIRDELIYFVGIYCKYDGLTVDELPSLNLAKDMTAKITVEAQWEIESIEYYDGRYAIKLTNNYSGTNEVTIQILTMNAKTMKFLRKHRMGKFGYSDILES